MKEKTKMDNIFYTRENYWVFIENDVATIGLTNFILDEMNIINFIELPTIGTVCNRTELIGEINYNDDESFSIYSSFTGEIIDINDSIIDNCDKLLSDDRDDNWLYRISINSKTELEDELISEEEYEEYLEDIK